MTSRPETARRDSGIRLFIDQPLAAGKAVALSPEQANYLMAVMRLSLGDSLLIFNGKDGEWLAHIAEANKRRGVLICEAETRPQVSAPDLWLIFTPIKKERTNFVVEKAVELGVAKILPVSTRFMNSDRWRGDKQAAHAIEAAEQCGATHVPELQELQPLEKLLADWPAERVLFWADESLASDASAAGLPPVTHGAASAILIGPEGGFSPEEKAKLRSLPHVRPIRLGPRILRAETAAVAAITLWQSQYGDWDQNA